MRALVVVLLLCELARAAPKYSHAPLASKDAVVVAAERTWTIASASRGPAQSDLWEDAAVAFAAIAEAGTLPRADLVLASRAALAAFKNAMHVDPHARVQPPKKFDPDFTPVPPPQVLAPRDQRLIRVLDIAARFETSADQVASLAFLRANVWRRYDHFDKAIPIYLDLIENHASHETAEFSANLLLDTYHRQQRYAELVALANKLRANKVMLANRPDLVRTVNQIYVQSLRHHVVQAERRARTTGDHAMFDECGAAYLAIVDTAGIEDKQDELLYNALVCFEHGGSIDRVTEIVGHLTKRFPTSKLTTTAELRGLHMLARTGRMDEGATVGERWLRDHALEAKALEVLEDTIRWRHATGDLDLAVRTFDDVAKRVRGVPASRDRTALVGIELAELLLEDGAAAYARAAPDGRMANAAAAHAAYARRRADAVRIVSRPPSLARSFATDGSTRVEIATVIAAAACPVPLVDGLCPRVRDPSVMATARRELSRVQHPNDAATLLLADLALEAILAKRAPTANLDADYRHLAASADADVRVAARARLAAFAKHTGDAREHVAHLDACIADAFAARAGDARVAICLRERDAIDAVLASPSRVSPARATPPGAPSSTRELLPAVGAPAVFAIVQPRLPTPLPPSRETVFDFPDDVIE